MNFGDLDGNYFGGDHKGPPFGSFHQPQRIFSGWDDYRSEYPLLTLVAPKAVNDQINSMVELAEDNGTHFFDRWEIMGNYTVCMIGNPQVVVINDAWQKGIRGFDIEKAYDSVHQHHAKSTATGNSDTRPDRFPRPRSMDWMTGIWPDWRPRLANKEDAAKYLERSQAYQKLFDPDAPWTYDAAGKDARPEWKGWFRAKDGKGNFLPWRGLLSPA